MSDLSYSEWFSAISNENKMATEKCYNIGVFRSTNDVLLAFLFF